MYQLGMAASGRPSRLNHFFSSPQYVNPVGLFVFLMGMYLYGTRVWNQSLHVKYVIYRHWHI